MAYDRDACSNTPAGAAVDARGCEIDRAGYDLPRVIELPDVNLANGSSELNSQARAQLDKVAQDLLANRDIKL